MCTACANVRKKIDLDFEVTSGARLIYSLGQNYEEWFTHDTNTRKSTCESGRCKHRRNGSIFCQQANKCIQSHWLFPKMVTEIEEKHCTCFFFLGGGGGGGGMDARKLLVFS